LLRRINMKREVWPGGPKVGEVLEAQLSPAPTAPAATEPPEGATASVNLLLLLR
jgi:hypothetical protein